MALNEFVSTITQDRQSKISVLRRSNWGGDDVVACQFQAGAMQQPYPPQDSDSVNESSNKCPAAICHGTTVANALNIICEGGRFRPSSGTAGDGGSSAPFAFTQKIGARQSFSGGIEILPSMALCGARQEMFSSPRLWRSPAERAGA